MNKKHLALVALLISICSFAVRADVAPDPGYTRVSVNLILEAEDDFPKYRFFLQSPIDIEEISLKKGETVVDSATRGGAKRFGTLIAVPRDALAKAGFGEAGKNDSALDLKRLNEEIRGKKIEGVVELVRHSFQTHILITEKPSWKNPVYKLEKDESKGIRATLTQQQQSGSVSFGLYEVERSLNPLGISLVVGGLLISGAVVFLGIWFFKGKRRKLV